MKLVPAQSAARSITICVLGGETGHRAALAAALSRAGYQPTASGPGADLGVALQVFSQMGYCSRETGQQCMEHGWEGPAMTPGR